MSVPTSENIVKGGKIGCGDRQEKGTKISPRI